MVSSSSSCPTMTKEELEGNPSVSEASRPADWCKCLECSDQILWVDQLTTEDNCGALAAWEASKHWLPCTQKGREEKNQFILENFIFRSTLSVFLLLPFLSQYHRLCYFARSSSSISILFSLEEKKINSHQNSIINIF